MIKTFFSELFDLRGPLLVAPMGGGPTTPDLVAVSSNAGALGVLAGAYLSPEHLRADIRQVKDLTQRPFGVNLFAPVPKPNPTLAQIQHALEETRVYRQELGIPDPILQPPFHEDFDAQFSVILEEIPPVFSFVFGLIEKPHLEECRRRKIFTIGAATTLEEGLALEAFGVNAVIAQGFESGGHRAMFSPDTEDPGIGTLVLAQLLACKLKVPVIASGGIMNGQGIAAALKVGAQAVQLGTAFLLSKEAGTSKPYRKALREKHQNSTCLTRAFSGRLARGIENRFIREMQTKPSSILPFPAQNSFTRDIRNQATKQSKSEYLSLWAGTGVNAIQEDSAANIIQKLFLGLEDLYNPFSY